ncbi:MAG: hypothetical protein JW995_04540 [Melioribacteraceae bacterium]|nr:hypothetical protein [Melioribacteraceae bacterium]
MKTTPIYIGKTVLKTQSEKVIGEYIELSGESFYKISNYDQMDPFLMTIASSSNHWIYISSSGGLTAGRQSPDNALFPYVNDDKLHDSHETSGSKTILKIHSDEKIYLWEPFSNMYTGLYSVQRNLYKNISGTRLIFEEVNKDLAITFRYSWSTSELYGFIKESELINNSNRSIQIELLDGIRNVLPSGIYQKIQNDFSTLVDGYKKNELVRGQGIGIFSLSSVPSDRAEPSESLTATIVWQMGISPETYLISDSQLGTFRKNINIHDEHDIKGRRGSYFINSRINLEPKESKNWIIVADINKSTSDVIRLKKLLADSFITIKKVRNDVQDNTNKLILLVAKADGLQFSSNKLNTARHFSNTMFNIMRGGIFEDAYSISKKDFLCFIRTTNSFVLKVHYDFLDRLPESIIYNDLIQSVGSIGDNHFTKLAFEYLPLSFSRRHGDPSRPWNIFSINIKNEHNERILDYQGNWRDIFQNWEALALSFPIYIESMIVKFLNASTADGYNPYRLTRDGFDWEIQEPENPWANIGYWGDHQVIYLTKLLELSAKYNPDKINELMNLQIFSFANVPYRIKSYEEIIANPKSTIIFDEELDKIIKRNSELYGTDSKFLKKTDNSLIQVFLIEKLLLVLLVRLSNFIPGGGIWMNTQRPEWNDANNALVGNGISMVTLYYLRRFIVYLENMLTNVSIGEFSLSDEVHKYTLDIMNILVSYRSIHQDFSPENRKMIMDDLGKAGSDYRRNIYTKGFSDKFKPISKTLITELLNLSKQAVDYTISVSRREDGLYHSYNILHLTGNKAEVTHLYEMLEGQVAVLSSRYLSTEEAIEVIKSLRNSKLYREDQNSYILYPDKSLPAFTGKNIFGKESLPESSLVLELLNDPHNGILETGINDKYHFHSSINNSSTLQLSIKSYLEKKNIISDINEVDEMLGLYEDTFNHKEFTGRSGTFYKYEGLGSIYWHMVSKLLLAVQEAYFTAFNNGESEDKILKLKEYYYSIKEGLGIQKAPDIYGAFPTDAYSHTPSFAGAQQPGMTGQVKEDIISRFGELGLIVLDGKIHFITDLLQEQEFSTSSAHYSYYDVGSNQHTIELEAGTIAFTYCQVPFIYRKGNENTVGIFFSDNKYRLIPGSTIPGEYSREVFARSGYVVKVIVTFNG